MCKAGIARLIFFETDATDVLVGTKHDPCESSLRESKKGKENSWSPPQSQRMEGEEKQSPVRGGLEG